MVIERDIMFKAWVPTVLVISTFIFAAYCGLEIIPERAKVMYLNAKYFYNYTINVKRYSRNSPYRVDMEMTTKQAWNNNVTVYLRETIKSYLKNGLMRLCTPVLDSVIVTDQVNIIFNQFLHNEYRRSFIELHYKFCDFMNFDKFIGPVLVVLGISCPMPAGTLRFGNFSFGMDNFPNVFPFEKTRLDTELTITATNETMAKVYHYIIFRNKH